MEGAEEVEDGRDVDLVVVMLEGREVVDICIEKMHEAEAGGCHCQQMVATHGIGKLKAEVLISSKTMLHGDWALCSPAAPTCGSSGSWSCCECRLWN